uniref:Uncharacterized protein n=1 Tax=Phaeocystis antarctica TaxID=33657 RepID=A0A7S0NG19_9EUKA
MASLSNAAAYVVAFGLQTLLVFAGNSRFFGLLKEGSGWRTNVEMSVLYTSFVTPANWAFAIWGLIYTWELVAVCVLALSELDLISSPVGGRPETILWCWVLMNACQATWSILFARGQLLLSAFALGGIAASLVALGFEATVGSSWLGYLTVCCPVWLHAGWTTAAALVNVNLALVGRSASAPTQLAAAFATCHGAFAAALVVISSAGPGSLPYSAAVAWALAAIHHKLSNPDATSTANNPTIAEVGEPARVALEHTASLCSTAVLFTIFCVLVWTGAFTYGAVR